MKIDNAEVQEDFSNGYVVGDIHSLLTPKPNQTQEWNNNSAEWFFCCPKARSLLLVANLLDEMLALPVKNVTSLPSKFI